MNNDYFCPLLSTPDKKVKCDELCEWFKPNINPHKNDGECIITVIGNYLEEIKNNNNC